MRAVGPNCEAEALPFSECSALVETNRAPQSQLFPFNASDRGSPRDFNKSHALLARQRGLSPI
jgi:hypothetical protein